MKIGVEIQKGRNGENNDRERAEAAKKKEKKRKKKKKEKRRKEREREKTRDAEATGALLKVGVDGVRGNGGTRFSRGVFKKAGYIHSFQEANDIVLY